MNGLLSSEGRPLWGLNIVTNVNLTEPGVGWVPAGRSGWKVKRTVPVPMRGGLRVGRNTIMMHPATLDQLRQTVWNG